MFPFNGRFMRTSDSDDVSDTSRERYKDVEVHIREAKLLLGKRLAEGIGLADGFSDCSSLSTCNAKNASSAEYQSQPRTSSFWPTKKCDQPSR